MSALVTRQAALLAALLAPPRGAHSQTATAALTAALSGRWQRGLAAYQANGHALAERSLLAAYPVVAALVGEDSFAALARDFWHHHPPVRGDLAHWGDALPAFVTSSPQLADVPYLADVARAEWALHRAAGAADALADPASFALLGTTDPEVLTLRLPPGTAVVVSDWPVASLVAAHRHGTPTLEAVATLVQARQGECAVVWRQDLRPRIGPCSQAAAALLQALLRGAPLLASLDAALAINDRFDLGPWLQAAATEGLALGAAPVERRARPSDPAPAGRPLHPIALQ